MAHRQEMEELLRNISMYPGLKEEQLRRFHPGKERKIKTLLAQMKKRGRVEQDSLGRYFAEGCPHDRADAGLSAAVWVLLDFIDRVEYHTAGEFPVKLLFFAKGELYEVFYAALGQEAMLSHFLVQPSKEGSRRIVILEEPEQARYLTAASIAAFCIVTPDGKTSYFQKRGEE